MTLTEAEQFLNAYRNLLKRWTMVGAGLIDGDSTLLHRQLQDQLATLRDIAARFPDKAYSVDLLSNALTRNASTVETRSLRPESRRP